MVAPREEASAPGTTIDGYRRNPRLHIVPTLGPSLYKAELIRQQGPWRTVDDVELATLGWVNWFNNERPSLGVRKVLQDVA